VAYLAVAFANTHTLVAAATPGTGTVDPWTVSGSKLVPVSLGKGNGFAVRVTPLAPVKGGHYGALVQTLVADPTPGRRYVVGLWLEGSRPGQVGVELNEFRPGVARYPLQTAVPATPGWHHYTFSTRVKGTWLGLAMYVYRLTNPPQRTWFAVRGLTVKRD
jgi:hypothetical protein